MSPHPSITTPPTLLKPRQTLNPDDPYGLSSAYAELASLYPDLYSTTNYNGADYSSILAEYTSLLGQYSYSIPSYSIPDFFTTATTGAATGARTTGTGSRPTSAAVSGGGNDNNGGLSQGAKIGIGVGVTLAVLLLAAVGIFLWCMGKRKGKKHSTTIVAPAPFDTQPPQTIQQFQQPQMGYGNSQGYMPGVQQNTVSPPPQYAQPQIQQPAQTGAYSGYAKGPEPNAIELEQEYHFARPGVVEMGEGAPEQQQTGKRK